MASEASLTAHDRCPPADAVAALVEGALGGDERAAMEVHLDGCVRCTAVVAELVRGLVPAGETSTGTEEASAPATAVAIGTKVGRYFVLERLGMGGMGVVFGGYDAGLARKVALKLVRTSALAGRHQMQAQERLQREARIMARLTHPNVVQVYDVGLVGGDVFVTMEYVEGKTLGTWLGAAYRGPREIIATLAEAGRGLAAAHANGIVHRDFKPSNVMVDEQGRVRVMDFGLAHFDEPASATGAPRVVEGTLAYMPPEQRLGQPADPRSDQYAFCLVLYEALCGERPKRAPSTELGPHRASTADAPRFWTRVPAWLRPVLQRGLASEPADRYASMDALLAALVDPAPKRRRAARIATGAMALALAAAFGYALRGGDAELCTETARPIQGVWNETRAEQVRKAFAESGALSHADAFARARGGLDAFAEEWSAARLEVCEATHARGEWSAAMLDAGMACLDRELRQLDAVLDAFVVADADVVYSAIDALPLGGAQACTDRTRLAETLAPQTTDSGAGASQMEAQLAAANGLLAAGRREQALAVVELLVEEVRASGDAGLLARVLIPLGVAVQHDNRGGDARDAFEEAYFLAQREGGRELAAEAAIHLASLEGRVLGRPTVAKHWGRHARALLEPSSQRTREQLGRLHVELAAVEAETGEVRAQLQHAERGLKLLRRSELDRPATLLEALNQLAVAQSRASAYDDAERTLSEALAITLETYGRDHPSYASALVVRSAIRHDHGRYEDAEASASEAVDVLSRALGAKHRKTLAAKRTRAHVLTRLGRHAEAIDEHRAVLKALDNPLQIAVTQQLLAEALAETDQHSEALRLYRSAEQLLLEHGAADNIQVAQLRSAMATSLQRLGRLDEGVAALRDAELLARESVGVDHRAYAGVVNSLGNLLLLNGELEEAKAAYEASLRASERSLDADAPSTAVPLVGLARAGLAMGDPAAAVRAAERALAQLDVDRSAKHPLVRATAHFMLAQSIAVKGDDPDRARAEAEAALTHLDPRHQEMLAAINAFLAR